MFAYSKLGASALAVSLPLTLALPQFDVLPITAAGVEGTTSSPTAPPLTMFNLAATTTSTVVDPVESFESRLSSFSTNSIGSFKNLASSPLPDGFEEAMKASSSAVTQGPGPVVTALPKVVVDEHGIAVVFSSANDVLDTDRSVGHVVKLIVSDGQVFDLPLDAALAEAIGDDSIFVEMPLGVRTGSKVDDTTASSIMQDVGIFERYRSTSFFHVRGIFQMLQRPPAPMMVHWHRVRLEQPLSERWTRKSITQQQRLLLSTALAPCLLTKSMVLKRERRSRRGGALSATLRLLLDRELDRR